jgi:hypothetical protein
VMCTSITSPITGFQSPIRKGFLVTFTMWKCMHLCKVFFSFIVVQLFGYLMLMAYYWVPIPRNFLLHMCHVFIPWASSLVFSISLLFNYIVAKYIVPNVECNLSGLCFSRIFWNLPKYAKLRLLSHHWSL